MSGVIYQITCKSTNLKYIGQATNYKYKNGKPYNYGATGRWSDHVCTSKSRNTPLCNAINKYGKDNFEIEVIEEAPLETLDEKEAYWILTNNTIYPNGYNIAKHSRNRHREDSNLHIFYKDKVQSAIISPIKHNGELKMAYVYLTLNDDKEERLAFGQKSDSTYEQAINEATEFLNKLKCPYTISTNYSDKLSEKYASKLIQFKNKEITSVHITSASHLIAVYVGTSEMIRNSEHKRICFGGKTVSKEEAYKIAKEFVAELNISDKLITDSIISWQQATA
jgi:hypothetical protein